MAESVGRVLVVDDEAPIRELIRLNLELEGYEVVEAEDGDQAVARAIESQPDVVLLDVQMPSLDGWVVALRLRDDVRTSGIRIVLVTAKTRQSDIERGHEMGVDGYVCKPFDPSDLLAVVGRLVGERAP